MNLLLPAYLRLLSEGEQNPKASEIRFVSNKAREECFLILNGDLDNDVNQLLQKLRPYFEQPSPSEIRDLMVVIFSRLLSSNTTEELNNFDKEIEWLLSMIHGVIGFPTNLYFAGYQEFLLGELLRRRREYVLEKIAEIFSQNFLLNGKECVRTWQERDRNPKKPDRLRHFIVRNYYLIHLLFQENHEYPKMLQNDFGICNFDRYPYLQLLKQARELLMQPKIDTNRGYGVIIYARDDWNDFAAHPPIFILTVRLLNNLAELGYPAILLEAATLQEVKSLLLKVRRQRGLSSYGILSAHGSSSGVVLSTPQMQGSIRDIDLPEIDRILNIYFLPTAPIILIACSTNQFVNGLENAGRVTAPDSDITSAKITPFISHEGKLQIAVEYTAPNDPPETTQ